MKRNNLKESEYNTFIAGCYAVFEGFVDRKSDFNTFTWGYVDKEDGSFTFGLTKEYPPYYTCQNPYTEPKVFSAEYIRLWLENEKKGWPLEVQKIDGLDPKDMNNTQLHNLEEMINMGNISRVELARREMSSKYGRESINHLHYGEVTEDEYLNMEVKAKTIYSKGYPAEVARMDYGVFVEEFKAGARGNTFIYV